MPDRPVRDPLTVGEAFDVMLDSSDSVRRSADYLKQAVRVVRKVAVPIFTALAIIVIALVWRSEAQNDKIHKLEDTQIELKTQLRETTSAAKEAKEAANKAKVAAESADASLKGAIAASQRSNQDTSEAINRINEIYDTCVVKKEC